MNNDEIIHPIRTDNFNVSNSEFQNQKKVTSKNIQMQKRLKERPCWTCCYFDGALGKGLCEKCNRTRTDL